MTRAWRPTLFAIAAFAALGMTEAFGGCGSGGGGVASNTSAGGTATGQDASNDSGISLDQSAGGESGATCPGGCEAGTVCSHGVCVTQTSCKTNDDCEDDSYCDPNKGCVPWGTPPGKTSDPTCQVAIPPGNFAPTVKCEFSTPPAGDPFPTLTDVQATPIVVNFDFKSGGVPSIVAPFTATVVSGYTEDEGIIRVLNGDTCQLEADLGGGQAGYNGYLVSSAAVAVGDLDGDGVPDIVADGADGHMVAFTRKNGTWKLLWESADAVATPCASNRCPLGWAGPSIHDLDDDGVPEVIREGTVIDGATGATKSGPPPNYASYSQGLNPVLANLDQDPSIELTNGQYIWHWTGGAWVQDPNFPGASPSSPGFVAVADFGAYGAGVPATNPEIVVVHGGQVMIYAIDGSFAMAPINVPGGGGGAPTVADFDGDGLPEVGIAGQAFYTVFDIDCTSSPRPGGKCNAGNTCDDANGVPGPCPPGILWSRRTQDISSNITGSSVFDFDGDGKAEVVYADECFARIYDGTNGDVLFSQYHSSCTWYENPVVADTNGDFHADLVVPSNLACSDGTSGIACTSPALDNGVDPQFPGLRCLGNSDCVSGVCTSGFCRCTATADCCAAKTDAACLEQGFECTAPPAGTPGAGNTCRAAHPHGVTGIRVYADAKDRWVRSRQIWNQHAYAVTNVNEDGTIPKTSQWKDNWLDPTLNNFRQNVPGIPNGKATPDLTAGVANSTCSGGTAVLTAPICNRGATAIAAGVDVGFYNGTTKVCSAKTSKTLQPGDCESVTCNWTSPPASTPVNVQVKADDDGANTECNEDNNQGTIFGVVCKPPS
jgi:CARDB/FG-GAP-like repeat